MSAAFMAGIQKALENEETTMAGIEAAVLNNRREKLLILYGDALEKSLVVADNLQTVAEHLQAAIDRLAEVDDSMVEYLRY
jgi:hypothetical protein